MTKAHIVRARRERSVAGCTHLGLASDIIQSAHAFTSDEGIESRLVVIQKAILDVADAMRQEGR